MKRIAIFVLLCVAILEIYGVAGATSEELPTVLYKDYELEELGQYTLSNGQTVTINGNGHTINTSKVDFITVSNGTLTLKDINIVASTGAAIYVTGQGHLIIEGESTISAKNGGYALVYVDSGTLELKEGTIEGPPVDVVTFSVKKSGKAIISGGKITSSSSSAIVAGGQGVITITGNGVVEGTSDKHCTAFSRDGGKIILEDGGKITSAQNVALVAAGLNSETIVEVNGGTIESGWYGVVAHSHGSPTVLGKAIIRGGTINAPTKYTRYETVNNRYGGRYTSGDFAISGGTFNKPPREDFIAPGYKVVEFQGGYRVVSESAYDAKAEEVTKQADEALDAIKEDAVIAESDAGKVLVAKLKSEDPEEQAAALDFLDTLNDSLSSEEIATLSEEETEAAYTNKLSADKEAQVEAQSGEVKDTTTPAGTDLLAASNTASEALKTANENLSAQPKVIAPTPMTQEGIKTLSNNLSLLETSKVADKAIDQKALEAVKNAAENLKTRNDIEILSADSVISEQAKAIESVFEDVQENLASVPNAGGGNGVVIASVLPPMIPRISGFFPLKINLRNLMPGRKLMFWPSTAYFNNYADSPAAANASLAAIDGDGTEGKEGDFFFLDENQVPVTKVTGDASKMTVVAYLEEGGDYSAAFITADATEKDVAALEILAADSSNGSNNNSGGDNNNVTPEPPSDSGDNNNGGGVIPENPSNGVDDGRGGTDDGDSSDSSSGSGGGCDLGLSVWSLALMALAGAKLAKRR